ncbi:unnamed protein product [Caenorhabditis auriculariae]|uniref:Uncharacterized protein n=1 Tax=Caenorhabditis auriculariae TaxID=2777116 RepID=A0A8S1HZY8_9PELO|nr:unnamed protein product [Caenorhabditis auriculariae]
MSRRMTTKFELDQQKQEYLNKKNECLERIKVEKEKEQELFEGIMTALKNTHENFKKNIYEEHKTEDGRQQLKFFENEMRKREEAHKKKMKQFQEQIKGIETEIRKFLHDRRNLSTDQDFEDLADEVKRDFPETPQQDYMKQVSSWVNKMSNELSENFKRFAGSKDEEDEDSDEKMKIMLKKHQEMMDRDRKEHEKAMKLAEEEFEKKEKEMREKEEKENLEEEENRRKAVEERRAVEQKKAEEFSEKIKKDAEKHWEKIQDHQEINKKRIADLEERNRLEAQRRCEKFEEERQVAAKKEEEKNRAFEEEREVFEDEERRKEADHQEKMKEIDERMARDARDHEARVEEMKERGRKDLEDQMDRFEQRRREQQECLQMLRNFMIRQTWNRMVERRWAQRLMYLRGSVEILSRPFSEIRNEISNYRFSRKDEAAIKRRTDILKLLEEPINLAISQLIARMEAEAQNMAGLYENVKPEPFLLEIKRRVLEAAEECRKFKSAVDNAYENNFDEDSLEKFMKAKSAVGDAHGRIPTLNDLKEQFEFSKNEKKESDDDEECDESYEHDVIIEEIEEDVENGETQVL